MKALRGGGMGFYVECLEVGEGEKKVEIDEIAWDEILSEFP